MLCYINIQVYWFDETGICLSLNLEGDVHWRNTVSFGSKGLMSTFKIIKVTSGISVLTLSPVFWWVLTILSKEIMVLSMNRVIFVSTSERINMNWSFLSIVSIIVDMNIQRDEVEQAEYSCDDLCDCQHEFSGVVFLFLNIYISL